MSSYYAGVNEYSKLNILFLPSNNLHRENYQVGSISFDSNEYTNLIC